MELNEIALLQARFETLESTVATLAFASPHFDLLLAGLAVTKAKLSAEGAPSALFTLLDQMEALKANHLP